MSPSLMTTRRFAPLFWCQFFAAFGDNFLKTALVFVILFEVSGANSAVLITLAGATLIAPFFFLSGLGGELADRYDKAWVAQRIKLTEIGAAIVGVAGFAFHSLSLLFLAVFMFGTLASLFGPIKYGILPDLLKRRELPSGNALIEAGTFLAILLGTIVAGIAANGNSSPIHFAWLMILTALASWCSSLFIPHTPEAAPDLRINGNIFASTGSLIKLVRADPRLWWGAIVASWFWLVGALVLSLLPPLVSFNIGGSEQVVTLFLTIFSVVGRHRLRSCRLARRRAHRAVADRGCHRAARPVFARSRLDRVRGGAGDKPAEHRRLFRRAAQHPPRRRSCRPGDRRRPLHRAGVHRDSGLGRHRSARPRRRGGQRAQCRFHGRRRDRARASAKARA